MYESFLKAVLTISRFLYPQESSVDATIKFYKKFMRTEIEQLKAINQGQSNQPLNKALWEKDVKLMRTLAPRIAKLYPLYWKNELIICKEKSKFENEQDSQKELQRFVRDFNLVFLLQAKNLQTFNRMLEESLNQSTDFLGLEVSIIDIGHTFKLSMLLHFLLKCAHQFYPANGLSELLEKMEFSKGTEWVRSEGIRISFINHYDVKIQEETVIVGIDTARYGTARTNTGFYQTVGSAASLGPSKNYSSSQSKQQQPQPFLNSTMINSREFALKLNKYLG